MALIVIAADKGAPGVTTTALALAAVWPRPVLLAECDPSGGDLVYRFPAADGSALDPRRGLMTLAVAGRRGLQPAQLWEHTQKLSGGLDVLTGVINAEQGTSLGAFWGPLGDLFGALSGGDVIADCGRLGPDGPHYDLLVKAAAVLLVTRPNPGDVIRLRDRAAAVTAAANARGRRGVTPAVVLIADQRTLRATAAEVGQALAQGNVPAAVVGGIADDPKGAELLRGEWGGRLDKTLLIRSARETAQQLTARLSAGRDTTVSQVPGSQVPGSQVPGSQVPGPQAPVSQPSVSPPAPAPYAPGQQYPPTAQQQYPAAPQYQQQQPPQYPAQQQPQAAQQYPPGQRQHGAGGRHAAAVQPAPVQANTVQPNTVQPNTVQASALQASALQANAVPPNTVQPAPAAGHEAGDGRWTTA